MCNHALSVLIEEFLVIASYVSGGRCGWKVTSGIQEACLTVKVAQHTHFISVQQLSVTSLSRQVTKASYVLNVVLHMIVL